MKTLIPPRSNIRKKKNNKIVRDTITAKNVLMTVGIVGAAMVHTGRDKRYL
jgi:hypothetical protein